MKKTLLTFTVASFLVIGSTKAQTYYLPLQDFNSAVAPTLPTSWSSSPASIWKTGAPNTLLPILSSYGISANSTSHMAAVGVDGTIAANNGAMLVTPSMAIPAGASSAAISFDLCFLGNGSAANNVETMQLLSSIDGGTTWVSVGSIPANTQYVWTPNIMSVGTLAGQSNVKFAIKYNQSTASGASIGAALDNIKVWMYTDAKLYSAGTGDPQLGNTVYLQAGVAPKLSGSVENLGTSGLNPSIYYQIGSAAPVGPVATTPVTTNAQTVATYTTSALPALAAGASSNVKVWVAATNDQDHTNDTLSLTLTVPTSSPAKKLVFEEETGTWCGWCPRGTVNMENFADANPGAAAQIAVHNSDPMTVTAYDGYMANFISGFPSIVTDRRAVDDPGDIATIYTNKKNDFAFADVTMAAPTVSGNNVSIAVTVKPAVNIPNPNLALVITESNLQSTTGTSSADSAWYQHNYYAGGSNGAMGGFETKGSVVPGTRFHFVARSITDPTGTTSATGTRPTTWPTTLIAGQTYTATMTATLSSTWVPANLQYIVMLNDSVGQSTLNSAFSALPTLLPTFPTTAITNVNAGITKAQLYPNPASDKAYLEVDLQDAINAALNITDAVGRTVATIGEKQLHSGNNVIEVPTSTLTNGMYFVNMTTSKGNISLKLEIVK